MVLLEPVQPLIEQAVNSSAQWKGIEASEKSVLFIRKPLQQFDPSAKISDVHAFSHVGAPIDHKQNAGYNVIWCQWCLPHLSDKQLVRFMKQARASLRPGGVIIVKENCCPEAKPGEPEAVYDEDDSSLTR